MSLTTPCRRALPDSLRDGHLYVFLLGPGTGESVVLRLPSGPWVVIDSYRPAGDLALAIHILRRYGAVELGALLLTHPHQDHYLGIPELLDAIEMVHVVGFLGINEEPAVPAIRSAGWAVARDDAVLAAALGGARAALSRLQDRVRDGLSVGANLELGAEISIPGSPDRLDVLWPPGDVAGRYFARALSARDLRNRANDLSAVLRFRWNGHQWLFGGDLANRRGFGWDALEDLRDHHAMKIPHHGSKEALSRQWTDPPDRPTSRVWLASPFSCQRLPRMEDGEGMSRLLQHEASVLLTALPTGYVAGREGHRLPRSAIVPAGRPSAFASLGLEEPAARDRRPAGDCIAGACFSADGTCLERYCLPGAFEIVEEKSGGSSSSVGAS